MKLNRLIGLLLLLTICGCYALPPSQSTSRVPVRAKQTTPISTNTGTSTTTAIMSNVSTEARVKSSASTMSATMATKKPIISVKEATVTPPTSAKETRESPGKIRPQIKLTTNYTSASEVSTLPRKFTTYTTIFFKFFLSYLGFIYTMPFSYISLEIRLSRSSYIQVDLKHRSPSFVKFSRL